MRPKGRRPKLLKPEHIKPLIKAIEQGCPIRHACAYAGIHPSSYFDWINEAERIREDQKRGVKPTLRDKRYLAFSDAIKKAESTAVRNNLLVIQVAARNTWQAAAWYLERRYPDEFGQRQRMPAPTEETSEAWAERMAALARAMDNATCPAQASKPLPPPPPTPDMGSSQQEAANSEIDPDTGPSSPGVEAEQGQNLEEN